MNDNSKQKILKEDNLKPFEFEIVKVNREGKIIDTKIHQAFYFRENLGEDIYLDMVSIPRGSFLMGSSSTEKGCFDHESPEHRVSIQSFFAGKYLITQAQWKFVAQLPKIRNLLYPEPSFLKGDNKPVEQVRWLEAIEFCARLSQYTGKKYRLPSEAEWEYICRAGTTTPFHFGETITSKQANYNSSYIYKKEATGEYREETTPVGCFPPNAFGLYDTHGLLYEWCEDSWHDDYEGAPIDGSVWHKGGKNSSGLLNPRVARGGAWYASPAYCRSAMRVYYSERQESYFVGFRVVCN